MSSVPDEQVAALAEFAIDAHATLQALDGILSDDDPLKARVGELLARADPPEEIEGDHGAQGEPATVGDGPGPSLEANPETVAPDPPLEQPAAPAWAAAVDALEIDLAEFGFARMVDGAVPPGLVGYSLNGASLVLHTPVTPRERLTFKAAAMEHGLTVQEDDDGEGKRILAYHPEAPDELYVDAAPEPISVVSETPETPAPDATGASGAGRNLVGVEKALALVIELNRLYIEHNGEPASAAFVNDSLGLLEDLSARVPEDVRELAAQHAAKWDERGWQ